MQERERAVSKGAGAREGSIEGCRSARRLHRMMQDGCRSARGQYQRAQERERAVSKGAGARALEIAVSNGAGAREGSIEWYRSAGT